MKKHDPRPSSDPKPEAAREPYEPPVLEEIEIVPTEAMLGACKTAGAPGAFAICGGGCGQAGS